PYTTLFRSLQQQSAAISGLAVRSDGATMGKAAQGSHGGAHQRVARRVVEIGDHAKAATVALVGVLEESGVRNVHGDGPRVYARGRNAKTVGKPRKIAPDAN